MDSVDVAIWIPREGCEVIQSKKGCEEAKLKILDIIDSNAERNGDKYCFWILNSVGATAGSAGSLEAVVSTIESFCKQFNVGNYHIFCENDVWNELYPLLNGLPTSMDLTTPKTLH